MLRLIHGLLLRFPPEMAHAVAFAALRVMQFLVFKVVRRKLPERPPVFLSSPAMAPLPFRSRVGLAAGLDKNAEAFAALGLLGFGFIEVGTVTPLPQPGNPRPRVWRLPNEALLNCLGFNNRGIERFRARLLAYRRCVPELPIFANIGKGFKTPLEMAVTDYGVSLEMLRDCVDGFVINVSSPNTAGLRDLQSGEFLEKLAPLLPADKPVLVKLAPDLPNEAIADLCRQVGESSRLSGVVLTNTSRALAESLAGAEKGGLSGRPLRARALECVVVAREALKSPKVVIGVGGISSLEDARAMRRAGADLVEIYTSFVYQGPRIVRELQALE